MSGEIVAFWLIAVVSVASSVAMVAVRNPVRSALALVVTFLSVAVAYVVMQAQFLAAVQVIVYAGAIMVLFLFVIMLLNLGSPEALREKVGIAPVVAVVLAAMLVGLLTGTQALFSVPVPTAAAVQSAAANGTVEAIGLQLFNPRQPWLFPFELTSVLLLVAVVGAIVLAKRRIGGEEQA